MQVPKYHNIDDVFPALTTVLKEAIQNEALEIRSVDKHCTKFLDILESHPEIAEAEFVVFSPHIRKNDQPFEHFVFLGSDGKKICHMSGREMQLYGLLEPCTNLKTFSDTRDNGAAKRAELHKA